MAWKKIETSNQQQVVRRRYAVGTCYSFDPFLPAFIDCHPLHWELEQSPALKPGPGPGSVGVMPPKKKIRGSNAAAKTIASGEQSQATAQDMDSVCGLMRATQICVESMYSLRHAKPGILVSEALPELPLDGNGGMYVWPVCQGGTFKDIAQRAWESPDRLIDESWDMVRATGILDDSSTPATLKHKFCVVEDSGWFGVMMETIRGDVSRIYLFKNTLNHHT